MKTYDQFVTDWTGKYIDFDGVYGYQCMDLMHKYIVEVLGQSNPQILQAPTAAQVYLNFTNIYGHEYFDKIDNTPTGVPQKGDIVFWGYPLSPYTENGQTKYAGHVAMFRDGNTISFNSFDQNFPVGTSCHIQLHNYNGCLGWLRYNVSTPGTDWQAKYNDLAGKMRQIRDIANGAGV